MITLNFWPLLNALLTSPEENYDGTPSLSYVASLLPTWIDKTPSEFERKVFKVLLRDTGVAPSRAMFFSLLGAELEPNEAADFQEFSSKLQMGMLLRYDYSDILKIVNAYEEARNYYILQQAQTTAAEIYGHGAKVKGETLRGWEASYNYLMEATSNLELSNASHDVRLSREDIDVPINIYIETQQRRQRTPPFLTGWPTIDASGGFDAGFLVGVLGYSTHGKSTVASNWVYNNLLLGRSGAYFSLEMSTALCMARFYALHSQHPQFKGIHPPLKAKQILTATLSQAQMDFLFAHVIPSWGKLPGQLRVEKPMGDFGYPELEKSLARLERQDPSYPMTFFVLDHPGIMDVTPVRGVDTNGLLKKKYDMIKRICDTFEGRGIVGIMPLQANEDGKRRAEKDPNNHFDAGAIAETAAIYRACSDMFYISSFPHMKKVQQAIIGCLKDRFGDAPEPFIVNFSFDKITEEIPDAPVSKPGNPMPTFAL